VWVKRLYDAVGYNSLVCAVRFWDLLQQLEFLLIYTYCTNSHCQAIYFWKQDSQSRRRTLKHHWRACRISTLYSVSTSNLSNRWFSDYNFSYRQLSLPCDGTIMRFIFQFAFLHLQLQGFSTSSASPRNRACVTRPSPLVGGVWARDY